MTNLRAAFFFWEIFLGSYQGQWPPVAEKTARRSVVRQVDGRVVDARITPTEPRADPRRFFSVWYGDEDGYARLGPDLACGVTLTAQIFRQQDVSHSEASHASVAHLDVYGARQREHGVPPGRVMPRVTATWLEPPHEDAAARDQFGDLRLVATWLESRLELLKMRLLVSAGVQTNDRHVTPGYAGPRGPSAGDSRDLRVTQLDEIGRRKLDLQPALAGRYVDRRVLERAAIDHDGQLLALTKGCDAAAYVSGAALSLGAISQGCLATADDARQRLRIQSSLDGNHRADQLPAVDTGHEGFEDARRVDTERAGNRDPVLLPVGIHRVGMQPVRHLRSFDGRQGGCRRLRRASFRHAGDYRAAAPLESGVINAISSVSVVVSDQDRSLAFYTEKLGFELQMDAPMGQTRWIQLAPRGAQTSLVLARPADDMPPEVRQRIESMLGGFANFILNVDDMQATYEQLTARGVEFVDKPTPQPWGWWASIKDPDANIIGLHGPHQ